MKKYKPIYASPEFHTEFKVFAAKRGVGMGELIEEIAREYMREFEMRNENKEGNK